MQTRHRMILIDRTRQGNFGDSSEHFLALFDHAPRVHERPDAIDSKSDTLFGLPPSKN